MRSESLAGATSLVRHKKGFGFYYNCSERSSEGFNQRSGTV